MIHKKIDIWEGFTYEGKGSDGFVPMMATYLLDGDKVRGAVLVLPGGGYSGTSAREAEQIAIKFNSAGFHSFVLYYSCAPRRHPQPLKDVTRAMCIIRENATAWKLNPAKIAVCGFSAGGHLAASIGVLFNKEYLKDVPGYKAGINRPDALILSYPVITSSIHSHRGSFKNLLGPEATESQLEEMSLEKHISADTPTAFIWHTFNDSAVPVENSILFASGLRANQVPFELHIFPEGPHGLSLATTEVCPENRPHVARWMDLCREWLKELFDRVS